MPYLLVTVAMCRPRGRNGNSLFAHLCVSCATGPPAALLRELVKDMPADKRLSFQTRVANARTKEEVLSVLQDFAPRLACLVLPDARSRELDLQQVKKVCS